MPTTFHEIPRKRPTTPLLDRANTPDGLRRLGEAELETLADELRLELLYTVGQTGGHFGAGLGVIELTIALHYVFDTPDDRLVWDVGHQAYPHKILTGRRERMSTLRQKDGIAAFPRRSESEYDTFGVGHSSTSISAALGMAIAARLQNSDRKAIAVIGDGALTAGMAFEALNHAPEVDANMLVILNDNDMSISRNVGGLSNYLAKILSSRTYASMREGSKKILSRLLTQVARIRSISICRPRSGRNAHLHLDSAQNLNRTPSGVSVGSFPWRVTVTEVLACPIPTDIQTRYMSGRFGDSNVCCFGEFDPGSG